MTAAGNRHRCHMIPANEVYLGQRVKLTLLGPRFDGKQAEVVQRPSPRTREFNVKLDDGSVVRVKPYEVDAL